MSVVHYCCVCVGSSFPPVYVERLYQGISRNFQGEWDFTVVHDDIGLRGYRGLPGSVNFVPSTLSAPPSWWHKINYFRPGIWPKGETVVTLDLDTLIVGPLDKLAAREGFNMISWPMPRWYPVNSSVMVFPAGGYPWVYDNLLYEGRGF